MSKSLTLILARHGNTFEADQTPVMIGKKTDLPLTEAGRNQALSIGEHLAAQGLTLGAVYSGSLKRQTQTAQLIQSHFKGAFAHFITMALDEIDYGPWEGLSPNDVEKKWPKEYEAWSKKGQWPHDIFYDEESYRLALLQHWFRQMLHGSKEGYPLLGISSQGVFKLILKLIPECNEQQTEAYKVKTGHLCSLKITPDDIKILQWNVPPADFLLQSTD